MRILRVIVDTRTHGNGTPESPFYRSTEYTSLDGLLKKDSEWGEPPFFEDQFHCKALLDLQY